MNTLYVTIATCCALLWCTNTVSAQNTFVVNSIDDYIDLFPGNGTCQTGQLDCTLRAAIQEANATPNGALPDLIIFDDIPVTAGLAIIDIINGNLPPITDPVHIKAASAPGEVIINSTTGTDDGLRLLSGASGSKIKGLTISNFPSGITISDANDVVIENNHIGISQDGTNYGNGYGILVEGDNNRIGGLDKGNVIGFNTNKGIYISEGSGNIIRSNYIGTDNLYRTAGNGFQGIMTEGDNTVIGGPTRAYGNVIGFNQVGIQVSSDSQGNTIRNNYIGTNESGSNLGHTAAGILLTGFNDLVGGSKNHGNIIGFNDVGILITGGNNKIKGNYIGSTEDDLDIGNRQGIYIVGQAFLAEDNQIGYAYNASIPTNTDNANTIAFNDEQGVFIDYLPSVVDLPRHNAIRGNHIYGNGLAGIDLAGSPGPDGNDAGDADTGTNDLINYPDLVQVGYNGSFDVVAVEYSISSDPTVVNYPLTVDVYIADDPASGEGKTYVGSDTYTTQNAVQLLDFPATSFTWASTDVLVLTTTDADGNTSEFSPASAAIGGPGHTASVAFQASHQKPSRQKPVTAPGYAPEDAPTLSAPYPNPFNPQTTFEVRIPETQFTQITVHDALGRQVAVVHDGVLEGNTTHTFSFDASNLASGLYVLKVSGAQAQGTRRLVLAK